MRNSNNTNQTLHFDPLYQGLRVQVSQGPLIREYLERQLQVFTDAMYYNPRVYAVRVDLRFSQSQDLPDFVHTNLPIHRFISSLRSKLYHKDNLRWRKKKRVNRHEMRYVWTREVGSRNGMPHYHLMLFFNGDAYRSLGNFADLNALGLCNRIREAWGSALGLPMVSSARLVSFPAGGRWMIRRDDVKTYRAAFFACSYLCKAATKPYGQGLNLFDGSRRVVPVDLNA